MGEIGLDCHRTHAPPDVQRATLGGSWRLAAAARPAGAGARPRRARRHPRRARRVGGGARQHSRGRRAALLHRRRRHGAGAGCCRLPHQLRAAGGLLVVAWGPAPRRRACRRRRCSSRPTRHGWPGGAGARNEPTTVLRVAAELARLRGTTPESIATAARSISAGCSLAERGRGPRLARRLQRSCPSRRHPGGTHT